MIMCLWREPSRRVICRKFMICVNKLCRILHSKIHQLPSPTLSWMHMDVLHDYGVPIFVHYLFQTVPHYTIPPLLFFWEDEDLPDINTESKIFAHTHTQQKMIKWPVWSGRTMTQQGPIFPSQQKNKKTPEPLSVSAVVALRATPGTLTFSKCN